MAELWLNIPQTVVLEATGDLGRAIGLVETNPQLLVMRATLMLPPLGEVPIEAGASEEEKQLALRNLREKIEPQHSNRSYGVCLRRIHSKLSAGVTTKGRRAPNLPLEIIDSAEFLYLELDGVNAVNPRTRETILYDLLVSARELSEGKLEDSSNSECASAPRKPDTRGGARKRARPVSDRDLRAWYDERVAKLTVSGEAPSGEADWEAAKRQFPEQITRTRVRELREQLAPPKWLKQGRRPPRTAS